MSSARGDDELQCQDEKVVAQEVDSATTPRSLEAEELFLDYLTSSASATLYALKSEPDSACPNDTTVPPPTLDARTMCPSCHRSRSLYCPTCLKLLIAPPLDQLRLPFDLDIILDDQKECATGVHVKILSDVVVATTTPISGSVHRCRLFDYDKGQGDALDSYDDDDDDIDGTYVLFPGEDSVPLNTLEPAKVKRLVVLDCKWTKPVVRLHKSIARLPKVHLVNVPNESQFWRWHSAGKGKLSTIEAIYYSAWELSRDWSLADRQKLVHLFWIFRLQRNIIQEKHARGLVRQDQRRPKAPPFSMEQKEYQRQRHANKKIKTVPNPDNS